MVENAAGGQAANEKTSNKLNQVITPMILLKGELFNIIFTIRDNNCYHMSFI